MKITETGGCRACFTLLKKKTPSNRTKTTQQSPDNQRQNPRIDGEFCTAKHHSQFLQNVKV